MRRREFLAVGLSTAGGLMISFTMPNVATAETAHSSTPINAWLFVEPDDSVTIKVAKSEMGQGVMTSLPMLIAEELEADWRNIKVEYADVSEQILAIDKFGDMATRDSSSVSRSRVMLQRAGAEARDRLIRAAAARWDVPVEDCYADYGKIHRSRSRDAFSYGELAASAAQLAPADVSIKTPEAFNILGLETKAVNAARHVDGSAVYGIDVRLPDMVYATVLHCPQLGGRLRSMRFNAIRHMPGVLRAVRMPHAVGVVAESFWQAKTAADELPVFWDVGEYSKTFSETFRREFASEFDQPGELLVREGEITPLMDAAERTIESDYYVPYLAHAPMEPINCTVHVQEDRIDVWVGHQDPEYAAKIVAEVAGRPITRVHVHNYPMGGGFGRRQHRDFVEEATLIALEMDRPVQMIWTREEELRAGGYRPMGAQRFKAGFDIDKNLLAFTNHSVAHSIAHDAGIDTDEVDPASVAGLLDHPYDFPAYEFSHTRKNTHITTGWWRSQGHSINAFAMECFIDEMANAAGQDPLRYRQFLLQGQDEYLRVLEVLAQKSSWGKRQLRRGSAMGMAIHKSYGTVCGLVAEVAVEENGTVRVDKLITVVDCGNLVNPLGAQAQVESGLIFGLTAALYGKLTIENGTVLEDNLDTYEILSMKDTPVIETHWIDTGSDHWGGLGEPTTPVVAPAVANAIYQITGRRIRSLPIRDYYLQIR